MGQARINKLYFDALYCRNGSRLLSILDLAERAYIMSSPLRIYSTMLQNMNIPSCVVDKMYKSLFRNSLWVFGNNWQDLVLKHPNCPAWIKAEQFGDQIPF
jgi:hypothetical protein